MSLILLPAKLNTCNQKFIICIKKIWTKETFWSQKDLPKVMEGWEYERKLILDRFRNFEGCCTEDKIAAVKFKTVKFNSSYIEMQPNCPFSCSLWQYSDLCWFLSSCDYGAVRICYALIEFYLLLLDSRHKSF